MNLTSLRRVKYGLGVSNTVQDHVLARLVGAASSQIVTWLRRQDQSGSDAIQLESRTEFIDPTPGQRSLYPRAYPITSVTSIYTDATGKYDPALTDMTEIDADDYLIGSDRRTISFLTLPTLPDYGSSLPTVPRGVRLIYTAGLAADPVVSAWTKSADTGGTLTVGKYVQGGTSLSLGYITARAAGTISLECLSGAFLAGETLTEFSAVSSSAQDAGVLNPTGVTCTLTACTAPSLSDTDPALVEACEMHVRFLLTNRTKFENLTVSENGATMTSRADLLKVYDFLPEIKSLLESYRNKLVSL